MDALVLGGRICWARRAKEAAKPVLIPLPTQFASRGRVCVLGRGGARAHRVATPHRGETAQCVNIVGSEGDAFILAQRGVLGT